MQFPQFFHLSIVASMVLATGCIASTDDVSEVSLDQQFQLHIGQYAHIADADLAIGFVAVTSDSRCGRGEVCVWEGDAVVRIWLQQAGGVKEERELHTRLESGSTAGFAKHGIRLIALHPTPMSGREIEQTAYVATLQVLKGFFPEDGIY